MVIHLAVLALTVFGLSRFAPGLVRVSSAWAAVVVAVVFSVLNFFLGTVLSGMFTLFLAVPALFTLGLAFFVLPFLVNAVLLWITDRLMASFELRGARGLFLSALVITLVNGFFAASSYAGHHAVHNGHWV
jgi:uncharacterized membrane protein YvlD (DUF360 family)